jgi:hypothetical protein
MKKTDVPETDPADLRAEYDPEFFEGLKPNRCASEKNAYKQTLVTLEEQTAAPKSTRTPKSPAAKRRAS